MYILLEVYTYIKIFMRYTTEKPNKPSTTIYNLGGINVPIIDSFPTQSNVPLRWPITQCIEAVNAHIGSSGLDGNLVGRSAKARDGAGRRRGREQARPAGAPNSLILGTLNSINRRYLQLVNTILICSSVHWKGYLLSSSRRYCLEHAIYSNFNSCHVAKE